MLPVEDIDLPLITLLSLALGGLIGSLARDLITDNALELPCKKDGKLILGFFGGAIVGAVIGILVDHSFITALLGGYTGTSVLRSMLPPSSTMSRSDVEQETKASTSVPQLPNAAPD